MIGKIQRISGDVNNFPTYTTQIMNLANQNAKGTRPKVVGQLTDLIQECPYNEHKKWKEWYLNEQPNAIDNATQKVLDGVEKLKDGINKIDENMVRSWVKELVIDKTFIGLRLQEVILIKFSEMLKTKYRLATPEQESKGIDGFLGDVPVSIKPVTYKIKKSLHEDIDVKMIFYDKKNDEIIISDECINQFY